MHNLVVVRWNGRDIPFADCEKVVIYDSITSDKDFVTEEERPSHRVASFHAVQVVSGPAEETKRFEGSWMLLDGVSKLTPVTNTSEWRGFEGTFGEPIK